MAGVPLTPPPRPLHVNPPSRAGLSPHPLLERNRAAEHDPPSAPRKCWSRMRLSPHPLLGAPAPRHELSPPALLAASRRSSAPVPQPLAEHASGNLGGGACPPFLACLPDARPRDRGRRATGSSVPARVDPSASPTRRLVVARRRPLPPPPDSRPLVRTPDVYVAASLLNRNATAKQRGRRGFREPVVDAGWGLFLARDMKRNAVVLNYRFVDGREGVEVDRLDADQLKKRYPDPLQPATHVLQVWGSGFYWDTLRCKGVGGFANSCVGQQNCLFRGSKIHVGKTGCSADTEVLVSYSSSNSYQWAHGLTATDDFYAKRSILAPAGARFRQLPWSRPLSATPPPPPPPPCFGIAFTSEDSVVAEADCGGDGGVARQEW